MSNTKKPTPAPRPRQIAGRVTRDDVARLAGVSTAVVSYVVNDGPRPVAVDTRRRVEAAIESLDYRPHAAARAMKIGRTDTYGILLLDVVNTFFAQLVNAIEYQAYRVGKSVLLALSDSAQGEEERVVRQVLGQDVEGLVMFRTGSFDRTALSKFDDIPIVLLDSPVPVEGTQTTTTDYREGTELLMAHLIDHHGHKDILAIQGGHLSTPFRAGLRGT